MLSLEKCHTVEELIKFANNKELVASIKLDGLTCRLTYENGFLVRAETRGNGYVGSDITEHVKQFKNVPLKINKEGTYIIDGEAIITDSDFAEVNKNGEYKNSRNLASGTLAVLDTSLVAQRRLRLLGWDVVEGGKSALNDNLEEAIFLGFDVVPHWSSVNLDTKKLQGTLDYIFEFAKEEGLPCDGIVFKFNDIEYGKSLGATSHHFRNGIAYKAKDEVYETKLIDIEWGCGKSGLLTPVAVFEPVDIDGSTITRSTVHNLSILSKLDLHIGDTIEIYKANAVIPAIKRNVSSDERMALGVEPDYITFPATCPVCGGETKSVKENSSMVLVCTNDNCKGKLLGKLTHFVSKNAMDIENLSESTLEKFIELDWLTKFIDIYYLDVNKEEMVQLEGFGEKSVKKLLNSIEKSKNTTLDRFIYALSIPDVGRSTAKTIASRFEDFHDFIIRASDFDWEELDGIGSQTAEKINEFIHNHISEIRELAKELEFERIEKVDIKDNPFINKNICVTGKLEHFTRDGINEKIVSLGAKAVSSVSSKTDFLVCNSPSNSSKYKKATELNIKVVTESEFIEMINS
jgi:DNA ligase (NAD+)